MQLARSFEDKDFTEAYLLVTSLPQQITLAELQQQGESYENAALRIGMKFETIGLMIYKGYIPIDALEDLVGEAAIALWQALEYGYTKCVKIGRTPRLWSGFNGWFIAWRIGGGVTARLLLKFTTTGLPGRRPIRIELLPSQFLLPVGAIRK